MTFDTNVAYDHLIPRKVRTTIGSDRIDLEDLVGYLESVKARGVLLGIVGKETEIGLVGVLYDTYGHNASPHRLRRYEKIVRKRMERLFERLEAVQPRVHEEALDEARALFADNPRDLSAYSIRNKNPVPGTNDLRLLIQLAALGQPSHLVTRDGHFLGYADLIREKWRIMIHDGKRLPLLLEQWRAEGSKPDR